MQLLPSESWTAIHYGLLLALCCGPLLVLYTLGGSRNPPAGIGMFTVYFMTELLYWAALGLQQRSAIDVSLDVPGIASIISGYTLFLAIGQRTGVSGGRLTAGLFCLIASLSAFFVGPAHMVLVQAVATAMFFAAAGALAGWRAWAYRNVGDLLLLLAGAVMIAGAALAALRLQSPDGGGQTLALTAHAVALALVALGVLAGALVDALGQLSQLETEDPLTRLANRRGLEDILRVTIASAQRHGHPTAAVLVDIDHFRQVNDSFGHEIGDRLLQQLAAILQRSCRSSDVVARTGGEEFLLVLPETTVEQARVLAERLRRRIGEEPLVCDGQPIAVTASLGIAGSVGKADIDALCKEARRAIYLAKRGGRNRVASAEASSVTLGGPGAEA